MTVPPLYDDRRGSRQQASSRCFKAPALPSFLSAYLTASYDSQGLTHLVCMPSSHNLPFPASYELCAAHCASCPGRWPSTPTFPRLPLAPTSDECAKAAQLLPHSLCMRKCQWLAQKASCRCTGELAER